MKPIIKPGRTYTIVPGVRVMDTSDSRGNVCGVCVATDAENVVFRADEGTSNPGVLCFVDWENVAICPSMPTQPAELLAPQISDQTWLAVRLAMCADPRGEKLAFELEGLAGSSDPWQWFLAALHEFVHHGDDGDRQMTLIEMIVEQTGRECKVTR